MNARIFDFRICLLLLAAMTSTARIDAQQPAKNDLPGSTLDEAEIRKLVDQLGVEQFRLRENATKRLSELADVPPALRAAMKSDNAEASRRGMIEMHPIEETRARVRDLFARVRASNIEPVGPLRREDCMTEVKNENACS